MGVAISRYYKRSKDKLLEYVDDYSFPPPIISVTIWEKYDKALIYDWNGAIDKTNVLRFLHLDYSKGYRWQTGDEIRITPPLLVESVMRSSFDLNGIRSEIIKALRMMQYCDYNLGGKLGGWLHICVRTSYVDCNSPTSSYVLIGRELR